MSVIATLNRAEVKPKDKPVKKDEAPKKADNGRKKA